MPLIEVGNLFGIPYTVLIITWDTDIRRNQIWLWTCWASVTVLWTLIISEVWDRKTTSCRKISSQLYQKPFLQWKMCTVCSGNKTLQWKNTPFGYFGWFSQIKWCSFSLGISQSRWHGQRWIVKLSGRIVKLGLWNLPRGLWNWYCETWKSDCETLK